MGGTNSVGIGVLVRTIGRDVRIGAFVAVRVNVAGITVTGWSNKSVGVEVDSSGVISVRVQVAVAGSTTQVGEGGWAMT